MTSPVWLRGGDGHHLTSGTTAAGADATITGPTAATTVMVGDTAVTSVMNAIEFATAIATGRVSMGQY